MDSLFQTASYKTILKTVLLEKKEALGTDYTFQKMADACHVQKTYLSRVLGDIHGKAHLNSDQLFAACAFLSFGKEELDFIFLLFEWERTLIPARKEKLALELKVLRKLVGKSERVLKTPTVNIETDEAKNYFLDPYMQLVHAFLMIDAYSKDPDKVRRKLSLRRERYSEILRNLERMGYIIWSGNHYRTAVTSLHLSSDSPLLQPYRTALRLKALEQIQRLGKDQSYSCSVIITANEEVKAELQTQFLKFLKDAEKRVSAVAKPDLVFQIGFDLVPWSSS